MNMFNTIGCVNTVHALSYSYGATQLTVINARVHVEEQTVYLR